MDNDQQIIKTGHLVENDLREFWTASGFTSMSAAEIYCQDILRVRQRMPLARSMTDHAGEPIALCSWLKERLP